MNRLFALALLGLVLIAGCNGGEGDVNPPSNANTDNAAAPSPAEQPEATPAPDPTPSE